MTSLRVVIRRDAESLDLPLPAYATEGAAGLDLRAALKTDLMLLPGERALVSTGIRLALPAGYEGQVRPRSGLAWQQGLMLLNSPGTIDADYSGTIQVILINLGQEPTRIQRGDRIAQLVIAPVTKVVWAEVEMLPAANQNKKAESKEAKSKEAKSKAVERGEEGFGSTGKS